MFNCLNCRLLVSLLCISTLTLFTCKKEEIIVDEKFELFVDYWNPDGDTPSLDFDDSETSQEVKIDFSTVFTGSVVPPNIVEVLLNNIRIIDEDNVNYEINSIQAFEYRIDLGDWKEDVEFIMTYEQVEDLDVMLILDASESLGADFDKIKGYANNFVNRVFQESPSVEIGIVSFSDTIIVLPPTNDLDRATDFIEDMEQGPFTALYEAINVGVDTLQMRESKGKAILTFTDGTNNFSSPGITDDSVYEKLVNDPSNVKVNSFTIGLAGNGGVDESILERLSANGGTAAFPSNADELAEVFEQFSKTISNVYDLKYARSKNIISNQDAIRLRFDIYATPK